MTPAEFRALFPALRELTWLDTPGAPPGAGPVIAAMRRTIDEWSSGRFDWHAWDGAAARARELFAGLVGVPAATVATVSSLAEAAATVAGSLPPGRVVVAEQDFRSNRFPWLARHEVVDVPARDGATRTEDLIAALDDGVALLAVSEVTSRDGYRLDLAALRAATDRVGARLFVNLTQSLGVLRFDPAAVRADYFAVHGYKWLLCPRGAAWLVARPDRVGELRALAPSWKSTAAPHGYFGGPLDLAPDAARCDASPAWFSWIGACAALEVLATLDPDQVERHVLGLAADLAGEAAALGLRPVHDGSRSHLVVLATDRADRLARVLASQGIRATALADRVRFGLHYFNNATDVEVTIRALDAGLRGAAT
ncbi:aminotransferase class V-fold PLP-dependent enzyme [Amycolatopsis rhabdoformis]|uniref:Aminotransferase class V-fold PLP-dependent enzyme n=1 Tax=Amycolatopsis rhabdoformis TaxID=1448059 RepID=A0ABZ1I6K7_9PSEU|nr:aminotransferase class V-fold PLP-dependent enzyme [Amycolatopsis rhabdoformis]WSE29960.1 aminotransferase class V-fold PLP-dependent enzyme [Amycolatopsis rhabdoformis]